MKKIDASPTQFTVRLSGGMKMRYVIRPRRTLARLTLMLMVLVGAMPAYALDPKALPTGANVTLGAASFNQTGARLDVTQSSAKLVTNWSTFNIGSAASVNFSQPSASSVALNRVAAGAGASEIQGRLTSNGQVFLLNPDGVLFGKNSQINVGGLVATNLSLSDTDFASGNYRFENRDATGAVINQGELNARQGGYIALLAPEVRNEGVITAQLGSVAMAAGDRVTLDFSGDQLVNLSVDKAALNASVENRHAIVADGGLVVLAAKTANDLASTVVNNSGIVQARSVGIKNGVIRLEGGTGISPVGAGDTPSNGIALVSGTLDVSGRGAGETGGTVKVLGDKVGLMAGAVIDASGDAGGGEVLVGGNYQGKGPEHDASVTYIAQGATINADALGRGDGGKVIVWADDTTRAFGSISVRGGWQDGDGGFAEVSGKRNLVFEADVDRRAPNGQAGTLLLDPTNLTIVAGSSSTNVTLSSPFQPATASGSSLGWTEINTALAGGAVIVQTTTGFDAGEAGHITITGAGTLASAGGNTLSLVAAGDIVQDVGATITRSAAGALNLTAASGSVTLNDNITLTTSALTVNATSFTQAAGTINAGGLATIILTGTGSQSVGALIAGAGGLTKAGTGTLTLAGDNTYTGATIISAGTVKLGATGDATNTPLGTAGAGTTVATGATLNLNGFTLGTTEALTLNGTGVLAGGALTNSAAGAATYSGLITLGSASSIVASNGDIVLSNAGTIIGATFGLTLGGSSTGSSLASIIDATTGTVTKAGSGTWTLSGANTYTGATTISAGTLKLGGTGALGTIAGITSVASGATLDLNGFTLATAEPLTLNGTGVGAIAGALTNSSAVAVSYSGTITQVAASSVVANAGDINLSAITGAFGLTLGGIGNGSVSGVIGAGALALTKAGTGTWTLSGANTYTGTTTVSAGTLKLGGTGALGTVGGITNITSGATLDLNGFTLATAEPLTLNGVGVGGTAGALTNSSGGAATYSGLITLGSASSIVANNGNIVLSNAGTITGAGLGLTLGGTSTASSLASIIGTTTGTVTKAGTGTWTLSGANTYTGATTISAGTLKLGSTGALGTIAGITSVTSGATLDLNGFTLSTAEPLSLNGVGVGGTAGALTNSSATAASYSGAITLVSASSIVASNGDMTLSGAVGGAAIGLTLGGSNAGSTLSGIIGTGTGTLTKSDTGTWTLSAANTYTGATTINAGEYRLGGAGTATGSAFTVNLGGKLTLDNAATNVASRIGDATALTLNGGELVFNGNSAAAASETFGALTLSSGASTVTLNSGAGGSTTLTSASIARSAGATVLFRGTNLGDAAGAGVTNLMFTAPPTVVGGNSTQVNKPIVAYAIGDTAAAGSGIGFVTYNVDPASNAANTTGIRPLAVGSEYTLDALVAGDNIRLTTGTTAAASLSINSLLLDAGTLDFAAGAITQTITSGALARTSGGDITSAVDATRILAFGGTEAVVQAAGSFSLGSNVTGTAGFTKSGSGNLTLAIQSKTYTGTTTVNAGTLTEGVVDAISTGALTVRGGTFDLGGFSDSVGAVTLSNGSITNGTLTSTGGYTVSSGSIDAILAGTTLTKTTTGTVTLSGANTYTGATAVNAGTLKLGATGDATNTPLGTTGGGTTVAANATLDLNGFTLGTAEALTLNGTGVLAGGALSNSSVTAANYSGAITLGSASSVVANNGNLTLTGAIDGGFGLTLGGTGNGLVSGIIGPSALTLTKAGTGTWTLSGNNTYTGLTAVSVGALNLQHDNALGATTGGVTVANGAALELQGGIGVGAEAITSIRGTGIGGNGAIRSLSGNNTWGGAITQVNTTEIQSDAGTLTLNGALSGAFALTVDGASTTNITGVIGAGAASLTKIGAGTLTLSGVNTYTGATTVSAGTLALDATGTIAASSGVANNATFSIAAAKTIDSLSGGGTTLLGANTLTIGDASNTSSTFSGQIQGSGGLTKAGTGTLTLGGGNTYTGATTISAGTLALNATGTIAASSGVANSGTLSIAAATTIDSMTGAGATVLAANTLTIGDGSNTSSTYTGVISGTGGLTKAGAGALTLGGVSTYTGATTIAAGTLALDATGTIAASSGVANSGTLSIAANKIIDSMTLAGATLLGANTLTIGDASNTTSTYTGVISGSGGLTKAGAGTLTLGGANTFSGLTTVSAGTLSATNATALGTTLAGTTVTSGATLDINNVAIGLEALTINGIGAGGVGALTGTGAGASLSAGISLGTATPTIGGAGILTLSGVIANGAGTTLTKVGAGTLILSAANSYTGATSASGGTLTFGGASGSALSSSAFSVTAGSTLTLDNGVANNNNRLGDTAALTLNGGQFVVLGNAGANTTETLGALNLNSGFSTVTLTPNAARNTQVTYASLAQSAGATALFRGTNLGANTVASLTANNSNIVFTAAPTLTGGAGNSGTTTVSILSGAIGAIASASNGTDFLTYNPPTGSVNGLRPLLAGEYAAAPAANVNLRLAGNRTADDTFSINSLLFNGAFTYDFDSTAGANTLTVASGNILSVGNSVIQPTLSTGTLAFGAAEAKIFAVGNLTLGANTAITGTGGVSKSSAGILLADNSAAITGGLTVNSGNLSAGVDTAFASQALTVRSGGTFALNGFNGTVSALTLESGATAGASVTTGTGTLTLGGPLTLNVNGVGTTVATIAGNLALGATPTITVADGSAASDLTISALISGPFGLTKAGAGTLTIGPTAPAGANSYTGTTTVNAGTLSLAGGNAIADAGAVVMTNAAGATLSLAASETIGSLSGGGGTGGNVTLGALVLTTGDSSNTTYDGVISGTGALAKQGTGTFTLTRANTHSGATSVSGGNLTLSGNGRAISSAFTVNSGGTLTLDNTATNQGDRLAGTLTMNGGEFVMLGNTAANSTETITALTLNAGHSTITLTPNAGFNTRLTFTNTLTRTAGATGLFRGTNLGANTTASNTAGASNLVFTAAPTLIGAGGGVGTTTMSIVKGAIGAGGASGHTSLGSDFVTYVAADGLRPLAAGEYQTDPAGALTAGANVKLTANRSFEDNVSINSLLLGGGVTYDFDPATTSNTLTLGAAARSGNILSIGAANTIQTGVAATAIAFAGFEADIFTVGDLTLGSLVPVTGTVGLAKSGSGVLLENRATALTGGLFVNQGTLRSGINAAFASQAATVRAAGTLDLATFNNTFSALNLDSGALSGATVTTGTGTLSLGGNVALNANGAGTIGATISGNLALGGANRTFTIANGTANNDLTVSALVSDGTFGVIKAGAGQMVLSGANTYAGATAINAGTLVAANNTALGNTAGGTTVAAAATLALQGNITVAAAEALSTIGTGVVVDGTNSGALRNLSGDNTWGGTVTLTGASEIQSDAGSLTLTGAANSVTGAFNLTVDGATNTAINGTITTGVGTLTKAGSGSLTLSGTNTFAGATAVNSGVLNIRSDSALGGTVAGTTVAIGASLELQGGITVGAEVLTINNTGVSSNGALRNISGDNTWGGLVALNSARNEIQSDAGTLTFNAANSVTGATRTLIFDGAGNGMISGTITTTTGGLTKNGGGTLTLSNIANTYTGQTAINAGTLSVAKMAAGGVSSSIGATVAGAPILLGSASGAILSYTGGTDTSDRLISINGAGGGTIQATAAGTLTLSGAIDNAGNPLSFDANTGNITGTGVISGAGGLTKTGTGILTLSNVANTYTGQTTITAGTVSVAKMANGGVVSSLGQTAAATPILLGSATAATLSYTGGTDSSDRLISINGAGGGTIQATNAGTLTLTGAVDNGGNLLTFATDTGNITESGVISGAGGLTKTGADILTLSGVNTYAGATTVSVGTLSVSNADALGGVGNGTTVANNATLNVNNVTLAAEPITLNGVGVGSAGALTGTGAAVIGGTVTLGSASTIGTTSGASALTINGVVSAPSTLTIVGAGTVTATTVSNNFTDVTLTAAGSASLRDTNDINLNASTLTGNLTVQATGTITVAGAISADGAGDAITLSAGRFINSAGVGALTATTPGARWLVWSANANPFGGGTPDVRGGLSYDFKEYNATYGVTTPADATGDGYLYTLAPSLTPGLTGTVTKIYNATLVATLAASNFTETGSVDGDVVVLSGIGAYDTKNVGTSKTVTATSISAGATNGAATVYGYSLASTTANANIGDITTKALSQSGLSVAASKVYDATTAATVLGSASLATAQAPGAGSTVDGIAYTGDTVSLSGTAVGTYNDKDVPDANTVSYSGLSLTGAEAANYSLSAHATSAATITKAPLAINAVSNNKVYDGTTTSSGVVSVGTTYGSDTVTGALQAYTSKHVLGTNASTLSVTGYTVNDGNGGGNYLVSNASASGTITQAALAINAVSDSKVYDGSTTSSGVVSVGTTYGSDTVTGTLQAYASKNVLGTNASTLNVTDYTVNDGNGGGNYLVSNASASGTITAAPLSISAKPDSKTYSGTSASSITPIVTSPLGAGDTLSGLSQVFDSPNAGARSLLVSAYTINDGNGGANYLTPTLTQASGTINAAALTVTANNDSKTYDGLNYVGGNGVNYSGFVNSETSAVLGGVLGYSGTSQGARNAGSYVITPGGQTSNNYALNFINATLTVNKAALTVIADDKIKDLGAVNPPLTASFVGFKLTDNPNDLIGTLLLTTSATTATPVGTYPITPSGVSAANYTLQFFDGTLSVNASATATNSQAVAAITVAALELSDPAQSPLALLDGPNEPSRAIPEPNDKSQVVEKISPLVFITNCGIKPPTDAAGTCSVGK